MRLSASLGRPVRAAESRLSLRCARTPRYWSRVTDSSPNDGFNQADRKKVTRGVLVTLTGKVAEACKGVFLFLARYLYGGPAFGLFIIAHSLAELLTRFLVGGFGDGVTFFAARHADAPEGESPEAAEQREARLYRAIGTCLLVPLALSLLLAAAFSTGAGLLFDLVWAGQDSELASCVRLLVWVLPLAVLLRLPVEAVKAHLDMKWAVIVADGLLPILNLVFAVMFYLFGFGALGLVYAALLAHLCSIPLAWYGFSRYFSLSKTVAELRRSSVDREVLGFALPQSVNMMFNYGLVRIDALMLSAWVTADAVGIYALVGELARTIRAAKTSFSSVFAPLVARYSGQNNRQGLRESLNAIGRWTATLCIPLLLVIMGLYNDVVLGPGVVWPYSLWLPWMIALGPVMSCFFGLAGNLLLMTGHARLLLANSSAMVLLNILLNALLIPRWGLMGAATATMVSNVTISVLQLVEMAKLEGLMFDKRIYGKVVSGGLVGVGLIVSLNLPGVQALFFSNGVLLGMTLKVLVILASVALYAATIFFWPGDNPERDWLIEWRRKRRQREAAAVESS